MTRPTNLSTPAGKAMQSLLFDRARFDAAQATAWTRAHGYLPLKVDDARPGTVSVRLWPPEDFAPDTYSTIHLRDGVQARIAVPLTRYATTTVRRGLTRYENPADIQERHEEAIDALRDAAEGGDARLAEWIETEVAKAEQSDEDFIDVLNAPMIQQWLAEIDSIEAAPFPPDMSRVKAAARKALNIAQEYANAQRANRTPNPTDIRAEAESIFEELRASVLETARTTLPPGYEAAYAEKFAKFRETLIGMIAKRLAEKMPVSQVADRLVYDVWTKEMSDVSKIVSDLNDALKTLPGEIHQYANSKFPEARVMAFEEVLTYQDWITDTLDNLRRWQSQHPAEAETIPDLQRMIVAAGKMLTLVPKKAQEARAIQKAKEEEVERSVAAAEARGETRLSVTVPVEGMKVTDHNRMKHGDGTGTIAQVRDGGNLIKVKWSNGYVGELYPAYAKSFTVAPAPAGIAP